MMEIGRSLPIQASIRVLLAILFLVSLRAAASASPMIADCRANDEAFFGLAIHGPVVGPVMVRIRHDLGQKFARCRNKWEVNWLLDEFEKVGNRGDELIFSRMMGIHKVAVPLHGQEIAPNIFKTLLPPKQISVPIFPPMFEFYKNGRTARHTNDFDLSEGAIFGMSNNLDIVWYMVVLAMHHHASNLVLYYGDIIDPAASETVGLAGIVVVNPSGDKFGLAFGVVGVTMIHKAVLSFGDGKEEIVLDTSRMKPADGGAMFIEPSLPLQGRKAEQIFTPGAKLTVHAGKRQFTGLIRLRDVLKAENLRP